MIDNKLYEAANKKAALLPLCNSYFLYSLGDKMRNTVTFLSFLFLTGYLYEPPPVNYIFLIKNNSKYSLNVEVESTTNDQIRYDSIASGGEFRTLL